MLTIVNSGTAEGAASKEALTKTLLEQLGKLDLPTVLLDYWVTNPFGLRRILRHAMAENITFSHMPELSTKTKLVLQRASVNTVQEFRDRGGAQAFVETHGTESLVMRELQQLEQIVNWPISHRH